MKQLKVFDFPVAVERFVAPRLLCVRDTGAIH